MTRSEAIKILWQYDVNFEPHPAEDVMHAIDMAIEALEQEPIHCKDCKHFNDGDCEELPKIVSETDYCSFAERRAEQ